MVQFTHQIYEDSSFLAFTSYSTGNTTLDGTQSSVHTSHTLDRSSRSYIYEDTPSCKCGQNLAKQPNHHWLEKDQSPQISQQNKKHKQQNHVFKSI